MPGITQVLVIDDKPDEMTSLVVALNDAGISCRGILYSGQEVPNMPCPHVRIIFMDVNLLNSTLQSDLHNNFSSVGDLLKQITPKGPYLLVLWTFHPNRADELERFLNERLTDARKPFGVIPLDKAEFISGRDEGKIGKLTEKVKSLTQDPPALAVLLDWEEKALAATAEAVAAITMIGNAAKTGQEQQRDIPDLLTRMAADVAGPGNFRENPFRAVNEVLVPIVADLITSESSKNQDTSLWEQIIEQTGTSPNITDRQSAELNRAIHIDQSIRNTAETNPDPGTVLLVEPQQFIELLGNLTDLTQNKLAYDQFRLKQTAVDRQEYRWTLIQTQALCDHAWSNPSFMPFHLGMEYEPEKVRGNSKPAYLWMSPPFLENEQIKCLAVNARFPVSLSQGTIRQLKPLYRLRAQALTELLYRMHTHGSRPGIITITEGPKK